MAQLPEVEVTTLSGLPLPPLNLNLTPDSYNSLVNIATVLLPESTAAMVTKQFKEKQSLLKASSYKRVLSTLGVRETRLAGTWKKYFVVVSGSYIYFYREQQDLLPYHYLFVMSITSHQVSKASRRANLTAEPSPRKGQQASLNTADLEQSDAVLVLRSRHGECISLNFGVASHRNVVNLTQFLEILNEQQQTFRDGEDMAAGDAPQEAEVVSSLIKAQGQHVEKDYFKQSSFHLDLRSQRVEIKVFKDDLSEHTEAGSYTSQLTLFTTLSAKNIRLDSNSLPYETLVEVEIG